MVRRKISKKLNNEIERFVAVLRRDSLPIEKVVLFGSYAKGENKPWSDVDVCVVSSKFKDPFFALQYLIKKTPFNPEFTIEPVGFSPEDFAGDEDAFICEIKKTGIEVAV